jgi:iron complex outermembrane receptor protein
MRLLAPLLLLCGAASSQSLSLTGTVSDVQSVPISDVTVSLITSAAAGRRLITMTDNSGQYSFENLEPGSYQLTFQRAGFESVSRGGLLTAGSGSVEVSVSLPLAGLITSVDVIDVAGKATASRLEIPDRDLPVQVSSISQTLLQQQGVNDMVTALRNASGVQAQRWYGVYEYYTVRGFNQADVMLVDGMRLEGNRFNTQLNNVQSVEVLKGPSSVLYGGSALGGAINIIRKKPQGTRAYDFMYRGGRFNSHNVGGGATGPLQGSRLLYRLDGSFDHTDGWRGAGGRRVNASPSLTWLLGEHARVTVHQAFNRDRFNGDGGLPISLINTPGFDLSRRFSTPQDFALIEDSQTHVLFNASLSPTWEFRDGFLLRRTSDEYYVTEFLFHDKPANEVYREALYFHHTRRPTLNQADVIGRFNLAGMHHTLLLGYEYQDFYSRTDVKNADGGVVVLNPISLANFRETGPAVTSFPVFRETYFANRIHAFYWQDQIDVTGRLKINVGGRFDDYHRDRHRIFTANPGVRTGIQTRNQEAYTYRAGIVYSPGGSHQFYFNSTSAFTPVTDVPPNGAELKPRTGVNYEVGHRWQGLRGRVQTSLAFYRLEQNNLTFRTSLTSVIQAGQQVSKGVDLDINAGLGRGTRLIANYGYAQPKFTEFDALTGNVPRFVQRHAANLWLTKNWESGFISSVGMRYLGPMFTNNQNTIRMGGWTTFSGSAGYRTERWEWTVNAENVLNRARYFTGSDFEDQLYPGAPINVFSTIRFRFTQ